MLSSEFQVSSIICQISKSILWNHSNGLRKFHGDQSPDMDKKTKVARLHPPAQAYSITFLSPIVSTTNKLVTYHHNLAITWDDSTLFKWLLLQHRRLVCRSCSELLWAKATLAARPGRLPQPPPQPPSRPSHSSERRKQLLPRLKQQLFRRAMSFPSGMVSMIDQLTEHHFK